ncbi:unnamed protein product [Spirodela intermedia]|uniref:Uncharacterized protein n=1 Tax=Spirodela intermedia TaxID=51605 RepID=A0ABN7EBB7_SPIIN|nr:unnamed protein product [Spirodela intermedia]
MKKRNKNKKNEGGTAASRARKRVGSSVGEYGKMATLRLSGACHPTKRSWMEVGRMSGSFILRSAQQEEALHRIASDPLAGPVLEL